MSKLGDFLKKVNKRIENKERKQSIFKREFVTREEWKEYMPVLKYLLPVVFITGMVMHILGNKDWVFILYHFLVGMILVKYYTKRKGTVRGKKKRGKVFKVFRNVLEIVILLVVILQMYDTYRYTVAMAQIQFQNEGYVTVESVRSGELGKPGIYANEYNKKDDKVYQHVFEGTKYKSKIDITDQIKKEMERKE